MISEKVRTIMNDCRIDGTTVYLPEIQLNRKDYMEVAKHLEALGGKWNTKAKGFIFKTMPDDLLPAVVPKHVDVLKKELNFFPTPAELADEVVALSMTWGVGNSNYPMVLEPSAGHGALLESFLKRCDASPRENIHYCEIHPENRQVLAEKILGRHVGNDFLEYSTDNKYDIIIANPPFAKNQDVIHMTKMIEHLNQYGLLVAICSKHWTFANDKKSKAFRELIDSDTVRSYTKYEVSAGAFKESGTMVATQILVVQKT